MRLQNLTTKFLGRTVMYYPKIDSTQQEVWRQIEKKSIPNGTLILADIQTKGKRNTW